MLDVREVGRHDPHLHRPGLEPIDHLRQPARQAGDGLELREEVAEERVRLQPPLRLAQHHGHRVLLQQLDRIEQRVERAGDRVGLRKRLAHEGEAGRKAHAVAQGDPLQVGERLPGANLRERAPVVPRQLSPQLVDEPGLVCVEERQ